VTQAVLPLELQEGGRLVAEKFPGLGGARIARLLRYVELLAAWNGRINLVSRKDIGNVIVRHLIPCLAMARICDFTDGHGVLDIGTGGGLPGIPLAIVHETAHFTLVDSIGKKIAAVEDMVTNLGLANVTAVWARAETLTTRYDRIVARAVTGLPNFLKSFGKLLRPGGRIFYLKGGDCSDDLKFLKRYKLHSVDAIASMDGICDKVILEIF
jgi:16S rRNA (guanine527-N7)-methyltransferase